MKIDVKSKLVAGIIPLLFLAFTVFIPNRISGGLANKQKIALVACLLAYWVIGFIKKEKFTFTIFEGVLAGFIFLQLVLAFFIEFPAAIWQNINHWIIFLFIVTTLRQLQIDVGGKIWYWVIHISCLVSIIPIGCAFYEILTQGEIGFNLSEYKVIRQYTTGNTNILASVLALHIPFLLSFNFTKKSNYIFSYFLIFLCLILIFLLNSRGVSILIVLMFLIMGIKMLKNFSWVKHILFPVIFSCCIFFVGSNIGDKNAFFKTYNPISSIDQTNSDDRLNLWNKSIQLFKEKPIFGYGLGTWTIYFPKHGLSDLELCNNRFLNISHSHSFYFELLAETGIVGFFLFFFIIGYSLYLAYHQQNKLAFRILFLISGFLMLYGFFYKGSVYYTPHFFLWAFALSRIRVDKKINLNKVCRLLGAILLCLSMYYVMWTFNAANEIVSLRAKSEKAALKKANNLVDLYHPLFMNYLNGRIFTESIGTIYWVAGKREESLEWSERAILDSPFRIRTINDVALKYKRIKEYKKANSYFERVLKINNTIDDVKLNLMKSSIAINDWAPYDKYIYDLEHEVRYELERYYSDELISGNNAKAKKYVLKHCTTLDKILNLKVRESKLRHK